MLPNTDRLQFDSKKHAYTLDGKKLLSGVTTVISETSSKGALVQWAANMAVDYIRANVAYAIPGQDGGLWAIKPSTVEEAKTAHARKRDGAATKGTDTHALVEEYINQCLHGDGESGGNGFPFVAGYYPKYKEIEPFANWALENVDYFIAAEQRLYSEKHGYAGTCDFIAMIDGKLTIGDLKTFPKMWSADAFIQMGAYSLAWTELTGERPLQSVVVKMCDPNDERLKKYGGKAFAVYLRYALEEDEEMFLTRLKMYHYNENFISPKE